MLLQHNVALHICQIAAGSIAKVKINLHELGHGRVQIVFKQLAFWLPLFQIFTTQTCKKCCSSTLVICILFAELQQDPLQQLK